MWRMSLLVLAAACGGKDGSGADTGDAADADTDADTDTDTDADTDTDSDTDTVTSSACDIVGDWTGTTGPGMSGAHASVTFDASGTDQMQLQLPPGPAQVNETWTIAGGVISLVDTSAQPQAPCPPTQTGSYTLTFTPACDHVDFAVTEDACANRSMAVDGMALDRQ